MMQTIPLPTLNLKDIVMPEPAKETLPDGFTLDHAWQKTIGIHAAHVRYRDEFAKAYRTMGRFPCLTIQGAANHAKLNADMFEGHGAPVTRAEREPAVETDDEEALRAIRMQQDELFEIVSEA